MNQKVVFLDIDGTLVGFDNRIPDSTRRAVAEARARGHRMVVCTGRSSFQIAPTLLDLGFDAVVSSAGARVEAGGQEIFRQPIAADQRRRLFGYLEDHGYAYAGECGSHVVINQRCYDSLLETYASQHVINEVMLSIARGAVIRQDVWNDPDLLKVVYHWSPFTLEQTRHDLRPDFHVVAFSFQPGIGEAGEISTTGVTKASGMQILLDHWGVDRCDSLAVGDGSNDLEMIEYAGVGIAMGNAIPELKALADDITSDIDADGVWQAFNRHGLL